MASLQLGGRGGCGTLSCVSRLDGRGPASAGSRKVRAPQGKVLRNAKAGQPDGKWNRKDTAYVTPSGVAGKGEMVR